MWSALTIELPPPCHSDHITGQVAEAGAVHWTCSAVRGVRLSLSA